MTGADVAIVLVFTALAGLVLLADWRWFARWARWRLARPSFDARDADYLNRVYWWKVARPERGKR